jgi:hypothetical protein
MTLINCNRGLLMNSHEFSELFRDDAEIRELLEHYELDVPANPRSARQQILDSVEGVAQARLLTMLFDYASGFARMAQEIFDLCAEIGLGIAGQIQVKTEDLFLRQTELNSAWAFSGRVLPDSATEERTNALANELDALVARLNPNSFVKEVVEVQDTGTTRLLLTLTSPDPKELEPERKVNKSFMQRVVYSYVFSKADIDILASLLFDLAETEASISLAPIKGGVIAAFAELVSRLTALIEDMKSRRVMVGMPTPGVVSVVDEIQMVTMQVHNLAEEMADAERAERELRDFMRTDFWYHRWRIFEIWILVKILRVLQEEGGQVRLRDLSNGVWNLSYSRASRPAASATFSGGILDVFYQLFRMGTQGNDMPDLAVIESHGKALIVVDPKHGRSYRRGKVQKTLARYGKGFEADLTAVVNYTPMPSYHFDDARRGLHRWLLASDIRPGSLTTRRFELACSDVLLGRGYHLGAQPPSMIQHKTRQSPARAAHLVY